MFDTMKCNVKWPMVFVSFCMTSFVFIKTGFAQTKFEKSVFYDTMASGSLDSVNNELDFIKGAPINNKEGYEGALLIRKSGLVTPATKRLKLFKEGRIKLETAILSDNENTEFHFLRLAIEEHAPKIVKYHSDIERDKVIVQKNFKNLSASVQRAILNYCKKSKVLHAEEL